MSDQAHNEALLPAEGVRDAGEEAIAKIPGFNAEKARKLLETLAANASV